MDEQRARTLLARIGGEPVLLWRGAELTGSDIDVVVLDGGERSLAAALAAAGLERRAGERVWATPDGSVIVDPLPARAWPRSYPDLAGVVARASRPNGLPPVASPQDRLLIFAADAVGGRPLDKLARKADALLADPAAATALRELARTGGDGALAELIAAPDRARRLARRGRLPYRRAALLAARSPRARRALADRARERIAAAAQRGLPADRARERIAAAARRAVRADRARERFAAVPPADRARERLAATLPRRRRRTGLVIALSGMDGAGKSSATQAIERHLHAAGVEATIAWYRIGEEAEQLNRIALPVKRLLRRSVTIADPIASRSPTETVKRQDPRVAQGRLGPVAWTWILIVVAIGVRSYRRTCRLAQAGAAVVCDRWACDSLVDLEVRYGRHRAAAWLLRAAVPRPDVAFLLSIDAETAARRKPGDQALSVLQRMQSLYERAGAELGLTRVDATRPHDAVLADVVARVDALLSEAAR